MPSINAPAARVPLDARCFRLTPKGRACVDIVKTETQTIGSLSRYLHDVLVLCGSGVWFQQLQQFMPPRSLNDSLRSLLALGLIEMIEPGEAPCYVPPRGPRPASMFAELMRI